MTERLESIERSVQVCVNSVRVLHSYDIVEAKGSSDSDGEGTYSEQVLIRFRR